MNTTRETRDRFVYTRYTLGVIYTGDPLLIVTGPAWSDGERRRLTDAEHKRKTKLRAIAKASKKRNKR